MTVQTMTKTIDTLSIGLPKIWRALSLYPLYRHDEQRREYVSAAEAMRTGELTVSDAPQASVPTLHADNTSGKTVFFVAGEVVFGGRQDRIVTESFLVPPGGASIPVACVEAGRWSGSAAFEQRSGLGPRRLLCDPAHKPCCLPRLDEPGRPSACHRRSHDDVPRSDWPLRRQGIRPSEGPTSVHHREVG